MIRWGILGCGDVTEVKSGPALRKAARSSVVACMRRDGAKAEDYAARHGIARAYSTVDDLIGDRDVDAVYIATPPATHAALTIQALEAGKPVLVEKPMAMDLDECDAMIAASERTGQPLTVAYYRRALPRFEKMREMIHSGEIGFPRAAFVRHLKPANDRPEQSWKHADEVASGWFPDMQSHTLDWLDSVFGPATDISGIVRRQDSEYPADDLVSYTIAFGDIVAASLCAYSISESAEDVTIFGSEGSVSMPFFRQAPLVVDQRGVRTVHDMHDPAHVHQPFIERVIAHLLDRAPNPCPPDAARRTNAVLASLYGQ